MIFGMNTTCDISRLSQISLAKRLVKLRITISKYHLWYLCQILLQIMLLPIPTIYNNINTFYRTVHRAEKKINKRRTDKFTTKALSSKGQI